MSERTWHRAQWLTVPNAVTILRLALIIPIGAALAQGPQGAIAALVLTIVFAATDWIDGFLARLLDQRSRVGEILDPIADRIGIAAIVAVLAWGQVVPWWIVVLIAGVDLLVAATTVLARADERMSVTRAGKVRTAFIMTGLVVLIASGHTALEFVRFFGEAFLMIGTGLHVVAGIGYLRQIVRPTHRAMTSSIAVLSSLVVMAILSPPVHADAESTVDDYLDTVVEAGVPGIAVSVIRDNDVVATAAEGEAEDGRPMTADTPLRIESLSKSFTATAVMQLVEQHKIDLDRPVHTYLPEFSIDDPRGEHITVRQLLNQTSGMTDATAPNLYDGDITTLEQSVAHLKSATLASDPGAAFNYHNPNYHVLARMVEVVSGEQFDDYLSRHVFAPLHMTSTMGTKQSTDRVPGMARGHTIAYGKSFDSTGFGYFTEGSGGVVSTANDMAKWLQFQSNGGRAPDGARLVSQETIDLMQTPGSEASDNYGFGWYNAESAEGPPVRISHSGAGAGFGAYQGIFTESGDGIVVMINSGAGITSPDPAVLAQNLLHELNPDIPTLQASSDGVRTDLIVTGLGLITVALAVVGLVRARGWGQRRVGKNKVWTLLRLLPPLLPVAWLLALPSVQLMLTGRTAPYSLLFHVSPVALSWFLAWAVVCGGVIVVRCVSYIQVERFGSARSPE